MANQDISTVTVVPARISHAEDIHRLVRFWSERTPVLPKSLGNIYEDIREFVVALDSDQVIGAAALHVDWADLGEIRSVVVDSERRGQKIGERLIQAQVDEAKRLGITRVFVLTDQPGWFARFGFNPIDKEDLPHKVWRDCMHCPLFTNCTEVALGRWVEDGFSWSGEKLG